MKTRPIINGIPADNKRYFYQVDGEGIRYELVALAAAIRDKRPDYYISREITIATSNMMHEHKKAFHRRLEEMK